MIYAGHVLPERGEDEFLDLFAANDVLGGGILSRINVDLRETRNWSYGAYSLIDRNEQKSAYVVVAPVQADKTGASIAAIRDDVSAFLGDKGVSSAELTRTVNGSIREMPGGYETSGAVLGQMQRDALLGRPFDYVEHLPDRYRQQTAEALDKVAREAIDPAKIMWVVVGDKDVILPQLKGLGLPVEIVENGAAKEQKETK
jgi:predicted Zn-dependent peptidase